MDLILPVALIAVGIVCAVLCGVILGRSRPPAAPPRLQTDPPTRLAAQIADQSVEVAALRRQLTALELDTETRFRSLSGQISAAKRKGRGELEPEQIEIPAGPQRDALIDRVMQQGGGAGTGPELVESDDSTTWPMHLARRRGA